MKKMTTNEIRQSWIDFFIKKNHFFLESASLIPNNDPSLLWINSGVATLKDYFSGRKNPPSNRLVNSQKALRTNDFFNVGLTSRHQTLFEMLGNFSIGDYFKIEAINFAYELLTSVWEIDSNLLWITVFKDDEITYNEWIKLGIKKDQILLCDRDRNFWDVGSGPCGPCTEIYYDRGSKYDSKNQGKQLIISDIENDRYVEIWNIVFSQFNNNGNDSYSELSRKNIDTGAGLERIASISQDVPTNFDIDIFQNIIKTIEQFSNMKYDINSYFLDDKNQEKINFYYKVIADHLRASTFAIADGAIPSNKDRGYVLRRLIRRAIVFSHKLNISNENWFINTIESIINSMQPFYSYLLNEKENIINVIKNEVSIFSVTLASGLKIINDAIKNKTFDDDLVFKLVTTYGFPIEIIKEIASDNNISVNDDEFWKKFSEHQQISQSSNTKKAMDMQNSSLINLTIESKFNYEKFELNSKVIKLFDDEFNEVNELKDADGYVVFDETVFYATSGGQIHDTGYVNDKYYIDDVIKGPNLQHIHHIKNAFLKLNDLVKLNINIDDRKTNMAHHTSEHLLQASLISNINNSIKQQGAFKSPQKFSFDFQYPNKLTDEQLMLVQEWINNIIKQQIPVEVLMLSLDDAKKCGAIGHFENVYKKIKGLLRVIKIDDKSIELCGGTHVSNTKDIEQFAIIDHYSRKSGEWRIEAISTLNNINKYKNNFENKLLECYESEIENFKKNNLDNSKLNEIYLSHVKQLNDKPLWKYQQILNDLKNNFIVLKNKLLELNVQNEVKEIKKIYSSLNSNKLLVTFINSKFSINAINNAIIELSSENVKNIYIAIYIQNNKMQYILISNKNSNIDVIPYINEINLISNGKGSGKTNFARGGSNNIECIDEIVQSFNKKGFVNA